MFLNSGTLLVTVVWLFETMVGLEYPKAGHRPSSDMQFFQALRKTRSSRNFSIVEDEFMLDGKPFLIVSGSIHYFRMPAEYWRDRLRKLKAVGFNAVSTYVEWSYHEPEERKYRFTGDYDVVKFIEFAAEEGLLVLLRPGPYICAERDLGGLPYWLLSKYPQIHLRSVDKDFISETRTWMKKLFEDLTPLLYGNGGPIILVQVENEYGSYHNSTRYKMTIRDILKQHVMSKALLYTMDGNIDTNLRSGSVPGALATVNFGLIKTNTNISDLRDLIPSGPMMNSELYTGWLTHWGEPMQRFEDHMLVWLLKHMIDRKVNVNLYVFFGGTNFEFSAGANLLPTSSYLPDITSYDYDAPLNEAGDPTTKYFAIRKLMEQYNPNLSEVPLPRPSPKGAYGKVVMEQQLNILSPMGRWHLGKRREVVHGTDLPSFESLRQRAGLLLYETTLPDGEGTLEIMKPRDRIYVYVDDEIKGVISRMTDTYSLFITVRWEAVLSLLVETQGRINFGSEIHDFKGILGHVRYRNQSLNSEWHVTGYPLEKVEDVPKILHSVTIEHGPVIYKGRFTVPQGQKPLDTFLDTTGCTKGYAWVNGHNLGRYWPALGPQVTLYVPGVWLHAAPQQNTILILELEATPANFTVDLIDHPILSINNQTFTKIPGP